MKELPSMNELGMGCVLLNPCPNPQELIYYAMHTCYSEEPVGLQIQRGDFKDWDERKFGEAVVKHLLAGNRGHYGPLEEGHQFMFAVSGAVHNLVMQLRTHRLPTFDVQCLAGDTEVTFVNNLGHLSQLKTMSELYDLWENGEQAIRERKIKGRNDEPPGVYRRSCRKRISKMRVRCLDEATNRFTFNYIKDVIFTGLNPVYKVTLADGKEIKCTQNHRLFTPFGWRMLGQLSVGQEVMANGIPLPNAKETYQNKDWLQSHFDKGLKPHEMARIAGCSYEAIKKWAYHHNLDWDKSKWNAGITYTLNISDEERECRRQRAIDLLVPMEKPKGVNHQSWKDDVLPEARVYHWLKYNRKRIIKDKGSKCNSCEATNKLHVHHIIPVKENIDLAYDESNMEILCASCHGKHHKTNTINPMIAHPVQIIAIEYVGVEPTYDLEMQDPHHNFVANKIVVHNSQRYTSQNVIDVALGKKSVDEVFHFRPEGYEYTNRQGKKYSVSEYQNNLLRVQIIEQCKLYHRLIEAYGWSEEHARDYLPQGIRQNFTFSANIRTLLHLDNVRNKPDAQMEIQVLMRHINDIMAGQCPEIYQWQNTKSKRMLSA
jgi:thymidylate synthase (FAD)